jgi:hypothetical protein
MAHWRKRQQGKTYGARSEHKLVALASIGGAVLLGAIVLIGFLAGHMLM